MPDFQTTHMISLINRELHDLAQPLTSLQCRLEIGLILGDQEALLEAVHGGLEDLRRITVAFGRMREVATDNRSERAA